MTLEGLLVNVGMLADVPASFLVGTNELVLISVDSLVVADTLVGNPLVPSKTSTQFSVSAVDA